MRRRAPLALAAVLAVVAIGGCTFARYPAAEGARPEVLPELGPQAWPPNRVDRLAEIEIPAGREVGLMLPPTLPAEGETLRLVHEADRSGEGLLVANRFRVERGDGSERLVPFSMRFLEWDEAGTYPPLDEAVRPELNRTLIESATGDFGFRVLPPSTAGPSRGLVVHLPSLTGTRAERRMLDELTGRGWTVLLLTDFAWRGNAATGRDPLFDPEARRELRADPEAMAEAWAAYTDRFLGSASYAVEAAVRYLERRVPEATTRPLVITGYSLGAIMTPTVAARLGGRVDGAVLVGGGADLFAILQRSPVLPRGAIDRLGPRARREVDELYLEAARLDPYHTAPVLTGRPVLMVHAGGDRIVPARLGEVLWERLGCPERWVWPGGHITMFWALPARAGELADWLDRAVPDSRTGGATLAAHSDEPEEGPHAEPREDQHHRGRERRGHLRPLGG